MEKNTHYKNLKTLLKNDMTPSIKTLFKNSPNRFEQFSLQFEDIIFDYSKCRIDDKIRHELLKLASQNGLQEKRNALFSGKPINTTENRPALHTALRKPENEKFSLPTQNVSADVHATLKRLYSFSDEIRHGRATGITGKKITDVINIGIGGSDLGAVMTTTALSPYHDGPAIHFVANVDGGCIFDILKKLNPETTLIIVSSKSFTTIETMTNAQTARDWLVSHCGEKAVQHHFCAVSTAAEKTTRFGITHDKVFGFWDWVGGRYSIWSAIGLPLILAMGTENFKAFLAGGHAMDCHFQNTPMDKNLPVLLGLIGFYHRAICDYPARAVIPYDERLKRLPAYLQQLDMESNGKSVDLNGKTLDTPSGAIIFGEPGTNGQHAFFQLFHQGTTIIPVEFLIARSSHEEELSHHHQLLVANCFAQSMALMDGQSEDDIRQENPNLDDSLIAAKSSNGNRPSVTLLYDQLTPYTLGRIIALYEHRVFVEAVLYNINPFDQWGVELGKTIATALLPALTGGKINRPIDSSTQGLITSMLNKN